MTLKVQEVPLNIEHFKALKSMKQQMESLLELSEKEHPHSNEIRKAYEPFNRIKFPDCENEKYAIRNYELTEHNIAMIRIRECMNPRLIGENHGIRAGWYVKLVEKKDGYNESWWDTVMSNTPMEMDTNYEFVKRANGDVLIGGLGLGMILMAIQDKPKVKSILVVEKSQEVIDLVKPHLPLNKKVTIICEDIFKFKTKEKFDTIYIDIWNNICTDRCEENFALKQRLEKNLNKKNPLRYISMWREDDMEE